MIYLAGIYVTCAVVQVVFTIWCDLRETKRRDDVTRTNKRLASQDQENSGRLAAAIEALQKDFAAIRKIQQ